MPKRKKEANELDLHGIRHKQALELVKKKIDE